MMAKDGIDVLFTYYSDEAARDSLLEETKDFPGKVYAVKADLGAEGACELIMDEA